MVSMCRRSKSEISTVYLKVPMHSRYSAGGHKGRLLTLGLSEWVVRRQPASASGTHRDPPLNRRFGQFGTAAIQARGRLFDALVAGVAPCLALDAMQEPMRL